MFKKQYYINANEGGWTNNELGKITSNPSLVYGSKPTFELNFVESNGDGGAVGVDLSDAVSWRAAVDTDFSSATDPMIRASNADFDTTAVASGVLNVTLDATTSSFFQKIDGKQSVNTWLEVRGLDENDASIYVWQLKVTAMGAVDATGGE